STAMILDELIRTEISNAREIYLVGVSEKAAASLSRLGTLDYLGYDRIFSSMTDAMDSVDQTLKLPG
ncbi:MAG: hypothetical protein MUQ57_02690, partial [Porticoccus sp.]|nr:hypothetical protein [Porticoccus sp.]